jgi:Helicase associated domain
MSILKLCLLHLINLPKIDYTPSITHPHIDISMYTNTTTHTASIVMIGSTNVSPLRLGYWLHKQRRMKRLGTLPRIRFEKLDALAADSQGPGKLLWNMESAFLVRDDIWDKMCTAFEKYSAEHSSSLRTPHHTNLGLTLIVPDPDGGADLKLGRWLKKQRQHRHDGGMKPDREARLQKLVGESR